ncbi:MAG: hypothetical protein M3319_01350 [Actinomycetota bacterium]|nr:hypothetical protein [Actinomycetota bacterium]
MRIYKQYTDAAIGVVRTQPYRLASEVWGIGFKTADTIARAVGIRMTAPQRVRRDCNSRCRRPPVTGTVFCPKRR